MSTPPGPVTASGPRWSTKHHAPMVRRARRGKTRRTGMWPTVVLRPSMISTGSFADSDNWASGRAGVSTTSTGPLIARNVAPVLGVTSQRDNEYDADRRHPSRGRSSGDPDRLAPLLAFVLIWAALRPAQHASRTVAREQRRHRRTGDGFRDTSA